jgi:hypothetical protein
MSYNDYKHCFDKYNNTDEDKFRGHFQYSSFPERMSSKSLAVNIWASFTNKDAIIPDRHLWNMLNCISSNSSVIDNNPVFTPFLAIGQPPQQREISLSPIPKTQLQVIDMPRSPVTLFNPSNNLVKAVKDHMIQPSSEARNLLERMAEMSMHMFLNKPSLASIISEQIESFVTERAKQYSRDGIYPIIASRRRFISEVCSEFIERLELDVYNPTPVLNLLYAEFLNHFLSLNSREWGTVIFKYPKMFFNIREGVYNA